MVLVIQTLIAAVFNAALVTVVWLRHRKQPASVLFVGALAAVVFANGAMAMHGIVTAKEPYFGYAAVAFDVAEVALLAHLLVRRRTFETTQAAIDKALTSMDDGIAVVSTEGVVLFENPAMQRAGLLRSMNSETGSQRERPSVVTRLLRDPRGADRMAEELLRGDRTFLLQSSPIRDEAGRLRGHLLITRDVTETRANQRELERRNRDLEAAMGRQEDAFRAMATADTARATAEAANHAKTTFLANMSHELRTPLNAILGFVQLLARDRSLSLSQRESVGIIKRSGEHLLGLINDVLEISKIEAGRLALNEGPFDLHRLLHGIEEMFTARACEQGLGFAVSFSGDVMRHVYGDEGKLRQVLINLVGNSFKFTNQGRIDVRVRRMTASGEIRRGGSPVRMSFEVSDTGRGIDDAEQDRLFQPFVQAGKGITEGTGLGLSISRAFVSLMGGEIVLRSTPGKGSTFSFDVMLTRSEQVAGPAAPRGSVVRIARDQPAYRVLVADDQWESRELLVRLLASVGFEVRGAADGREAIQCFEEWRPHFIWMDIRMPVVDGYQATKTIKATPRQEPTIIVALTASAFEHDREMILAAGCDDFLRKPARESDVFSKLEQHLGVQFVYSGDEDDEEEGLEGPGPAAHNNPLLPPDLSRLPGPLRKELRAAAKQLNAKAVSAVVARIRAEDEPLADALSALVSAYRFDTVIALLERASQPPG